MTEEFKPHFRVEMRPSKPVSSGQEAHSALVQIVGLEMVRIAMQYAQDNGDASKASLQKLQEYLDSKEGDDTSLNDATFGRMDTIANMAGNIARAFGYSEEEFRVSCTRFAADTLKVTTADIAAQPLTDKDMNQPRAFVRNKDGDRRLSDEEAQLLHTGGAVFSEENDGIVVPGDTFKI